MAFVVAIDGPGSIGLGVRATLLDVSATAEYEFSTFSIRPGKPRKPGNDPEHAIGAALKALDRFKRVPWKPGPPPPAARREVLRAVLEVAGAIQGVTAKIIEEVGTDR